MAADVLTGGLDWQMLVKLNVCLTKSEWISKAKPGWAHGPSGRHCCSDLPPRHREPRKQTMCVSCRFEGAEMGFWACCRGFVSLTRGKFAFHFGWQLQIQQLLMEYRRMFGMILRVRSRVLIQEALLNVNCLHFSVGLWGSQLDVQSMYCCSALIWVTINPITRACSALQYKTTGYTEEVYIGCSFIYSAAR